MGFQARAIPIFREGKYSDLKVSSIGMHRICNFQIRPEPDYRIRTKIPAEIPAGFAGFETRHFGINWNSLVFKKGGLNYKSYGF